MTIAVPLSLAGKISASDNGTFYCKIFNRSVNEKSRLDTHFKEFEGIDERIEPYDY